MVAPVKTRYPSMVPKAILDGEIPRRLPPLKEYDFKEMTLPAPDAFFAGRVHLMIDHMTASAAMSLAELFRDYRAGTTVGYETSGVPEAFGSYNDFTLKNSSIRCHVSYKKLWPPKPRPGDDKHGVTPDVPLDRTVLKPYAGEPDPALAFLLDRIRKTPSEGKRLSQ